MILALLSVCCGRPSRRCRREVGAEQRICTAHAAVVERASGVATFRVEEAKRLRLVERRSCPFAR